MHVRNLRRRTLRKLLLLLWLMAPAILLAQNPNEEDSTADSPVQNSGGPLNLSFKNRPSLRIGEFASMELKSKWHFDFRGFSPPIFNPPGVVTALPSTPDTFLLSKARVGLKGKVTKYVSYEVERELRATFGRD